jgi:hypothetical protein
LADRKHEMEKLISEMDYTTLGWDVTVGRETTGI